MELARRASDSSHELFWTGDTTSRRGIAIGCSGDTIVVFCQDLSTGTGSSTFRFPNVGPCQARHDQEGMANSKPGVRRESCLLFRTLHEDVQRSGPISSVRLKRTIPRTCVSSYTTFT